LVWFVFSTDLFGIFDGHAGREAALFSANHITTVVTRNIPLLIKEKDPKSIHDLLTKVQTSSQTYTFSIFPSLQCCTEGNV
jgi:serine/threonine protein phosphatase PrpC